jgi:DNA-directed RNA polymerase specialized sigma24 family protein
MKSKDARRILEQFQNTDPMLYRKIYDQLSRYQGLDDLIEDAYEQMHEESRKQKRLDVC